MKYLAALVFSAFGLIEEWLFDRWVDAKRWYGLAHACAGSRLPGFLLRRYAVVSELIEQYGLHESSDAAERKFVAERFYCALAKTSSERWYVKLADANAVSGDWSAAISAYRDALLRNGKCSKAQFGLGEALSKLGKRDEAIEAYSRAISGDLVGEKIDWYAALTKQLPNALDLPLAPRRPSNLAEVLAIRPEVHGLIEYCQRMKLGHIRAAYAAKREMAEATLQIVEDDRSAGFRTISHAVCAAAWLCQLDRSLDLLERLEKLATSDEQRRIVGLIGISLCLQSGNAKDSVRFRKLARSSLPHGQGDRRYRKIVAGRRIAVVCPANSNLKQGCEIDTYDLVVRSNFHGRKVIDEDGEYRGRRCDISYYNRQHFLSKPRQIRAELEGSELKFLVSRDHYFSRMSRYMSGIPTRVRYSCGLIFHGRGFALAHIVNDLLSFDPSELKIFCADFFLGERPHFSGYFDDAIDVREAYLLHDPLATFRFLKSIWSSGRMTTDPALERILSLEETAFLIELEQRVSDSGK